MLIKRNRGPRPLDVHVSARELRRFIDLTDVYCPVKRKSGRVMLAHCPLHDDEHASLEIAEKEGVQVAYCPVCEKGGDLFKMLMLEHNCGFHEALDHAARLAGRHDRR